MKKISINILVFLVFILPMMVFAQKITDPLGGKSITELVSTLLKYVVKVGSVIATFAFVYVGYLFTSAKGNSGKLENAKSAFVNIMIGLAILLGAELIGTVITNTVGNIN